MNLCVKVMKVLIRNKPKKSLPILLPGSTITLNTDLVKKEGKDEK